MDRKDSHPFPFAHMVFFQLADRTPTMMTKYIEACEKYLSGHPGQILFSVGPRDVEIQRDVSAVDFDIAMHMVFENRAVYDEYASDPRHEEFITATAGMSTGRRVFDSYLTKMIPAALQSKPVNKRGKEG
jgi:hypothetical protein